jgi:Arc/MetJ-type ribon-helix-helix transcriptional regulator
MREPVTVGLSAKAHDQLKILESSGYFARMSDAYRFAIALGLSHDSYESRDLKRNTIFNVGTLDPDRSIYAALEALRSITDEPVYRSAERYAEWGVAELFRLRRDGEIDFGILLKEAENLSA